jgi:hypothetical protein
VAGDQPDQRSPCQTPLFSNLEVPLSDEKWAEITATTSVPSAARADIENWIGWFCFARERQAAISLAAKPLSKSTSHMLKHLETLEAHPHVKRLELNLTVLKSLAGSAKYGQRGWAKTALEHQFVKLIAEVVAKHRNEQITRSYKLELATTVKQICKIVANIGPGTVDEALKQYIRQKRRGENLR